MAYDKLKKMAGKKKKKSFQTHLHSATTVEDMMDCLQKAYDNHKKRASFKLLAQFQKHSEWLGKLFEAIDGVVQANTAIPCSIWSPLRLCLQVSNCHSIIAEQLVVMIDTIHQTMGRINIYKQLPPNPALYTALLSVFTDVVNFCYISLDLFNHSVFVRLFKLLVSPAKKKFQGVIDDLRRHTEHLDLTANAVEHMEMRQFREEARVESRLENWLRALDSPNMRQRKEDMLKDQVKGTCDWILSHENFKTWKTTKDIRERLLCVSGKSGCGKSFLAASVIDHLAAEAQNNRIFYLFFSEKGNKYRAPEDTLARSALSQILQELQGDQREVELASLLDQMNKFSDPTTTDLWMTVLKAMESSHEPAFWVIDGLDECLDGQSPLGDERKLDDAITRLMGYFTELLTRHAPSRVMVLGRPHAVNAMKEEKLPYLSIAIDDNMIVDDLNRYIEAKTRESSFLGQETQKRLLQNISKTFLEKSQGTFLWVQLVMSDIQTWASSDEVDSALCTLPNGLRARYNQMARRLENSKAYDIEVANQIFGFLTTAGRPLDVEELQYAQGMARWIEKKAKGKATLKECLIYGPEKKFLDLCGGFVHIQHGKVIFVHLSAKEYLLEFAVETKFKVDLIASHELFSKSCFDFGFLHGLEEDLTIFLRGLQSSDLRKLSAVPWDTAVSKISRDFYTRSQTPKLHGAKSQNMEVLDSLLDMLSNKDSISDTDDEDALESDYPTPPVTSRHDEALPIFMTAKRNLREDNSLFKYWVGLALVQLGESEEAEPLLQDAVSSSNPVMRIAEHRQWQILWLGRSLFNQVKYDEAEDMFRRGISEGQSPPNSATLCNTFWVARTLFCQERYEDAAQLFIWSADERRKRPEKMTRGFSLYGSFAGIACVFSQKYALAEETLKKHLEFIQRTLKGVTSAEMNTRVWLCRALKLQERYLEAESILRPVIQQLKDLELLDFTGESLYETASTESDNGSDYRGSSEETSSDIGEESTSEEDFTGSDGEEDDDVGNYMDQDEDDASQHGKQVSRVANPYIYSGRYAYDYEEDGYDISWDYREIGEELCRNGHPVLAKEVFDLLGIDAEERAEAD
ncbi:hypothetical protein BBK36DRAFT_1142195 [Trichoderma citrinoviride]|uniref:NACHT domain-containing protein n=1 Tax=Trichoderma citrinoviride TaxID=58853 RepID=A0A2T4B7J0_9HYPO|nr:hypothetical protein BBK36DRAFT_1142195 [Trichoderma citrinoviride]PTB65199.1 hypothetical protein BBK36DRAFT_1142195 [Trichoderma citrinoviride]